MARMRPLVGVHPQVTVQLAALNKALPTDGADVGPLARVDPHVLRQAVTVPETLTAGLAGIWRFTRVSSHVAGHVGFLGEPPSTDLT